MDNKEYTKYLELYRKYPHKFVDDYLAIKLSPWQRLRCKVTVKYYKWVGKGRR